MTILDSIIQGVVQGLTEFLPVSSSGHLAISQHILGVTKDNLFFDVMLHAGTLLAVVVVYWKMIIRLIVALFSTLSDIFQGKFKWSERNEDFNLIIMLVVGLLPLFLLYIPIPFTDGQTGMKISEGIASNIIVVGFSLIVTSILLAIGKSCNDKIIKNSPLRVMVKDSGKTNLTFKDALFIGLIQMVAAIFPGLSRSGSTLSAGEMRGLNRQTAFDYTFIIAIPTIFAAVLIEGHKALAIKGGIGISGGVIAVGIITSAIVGFFAIKLFRWLLKTDKMAIFIVYTACMGLLVLIICLLENITNQNLFTQVPINGSSLVPR
ncbi:MAG: undecaprenyl-diphosphate phosphatase [Bacillota bacterium]|nr:undecaprenyl-diphosphate phosphatase [Bacillota bacterium]